MLITVYLISHSVKFFKIIKFSYLEILFHGNFIPRKIYSTENNCEKFGVTSPKNEESIVFRDSIVCHVFALIGYHYRYAVITANVTVIVIPVISAVNTDFFFVKGSLARIYALLSERSEEHFTKTFRLTNRPFS